MDFPVDALPAAPGDGRAGPRVHSAHQHRLHGRDQHPLNDSVRPERDHFDLPVLLAALIVDLPDLRRRGDKALGRHQLIGALHIPVQIRHYAGNVLPVSPPLGCVQHDSANEFTVNHLVVEIADSLRHRISLRPCLPARLFEPKPTKPRPMRQYFHQAVRESLRQSKEKQVVARRRSSSCSTRCCSR